MISNKSLALIHLLALLRWTQMTCGINIAGVCFKLAIEKIFGNSIKIFLAATHEEMNLKAKIILKLMTDHE